MDARQISRVQGSDALSYAVSPVSQSVSQSVCLSVCHRLYAGDIQGERGGTVYIHIYIIGLDELERRDEMRWGGGLEKGWRDER
jgi:hypothetical protein